MQVAVQVPDQTTQIDFSSTWFAEAHTFANFIDETVDLLKELSQYDFALYSFYDNGQQYVKIFLGQESFISKVSLDEITLLGQHIKLNAFSPSFLTLKQKLEKLFNHKLESASSLKLSFDAVEYDITVILFSDQQHQLPHTTWQCIERYIQQRQKSGCQLLQHDHLQQRMSELESMNLGRAKYFSVIAHDLRAPFHGILGCADILAHEKETLDEAAAQRLADYIHDTTQSTYGLLENLLNWAMAENGRFHQTPSHFRVVDTLQFVFDLLNAFAFKKQIHLDYDAADDLYAFADVNMVTSVIQNLTSNALKFTPINRDKTVKIKAIKNEQWVEISIQDQGIGMTPEQIAKLFREHTVPSTQGTAGEKGTGLGLVLCKRFLDLNHGSIHVESTPGQGTKFIVRLPIGESIS
ncbi:MAG: HAMP domain-containing histidine kinase [Acinetobacter populi]|jgi:signal transduction histidine kinase|uniref:sensor histidine kinase n=1 Tax=Acinetobacter populi TaxID=1582270 RepID=UPI002357A36F|nr:HAMP domain-containing sensor histidine kinase [Acinetobacter populi]MCH4249059.1 HAMP domain-containing histidine kinase [Acinetobacter populi]